MSIKFGDNLYLAWQGNQTGILAGTDLDLIAPVGGYITELGVVVDTAVTAGDLVGVEINTVAVAGLTVDVADGATKGTRYTGNATAGSSTRRVEKGDRISITFGADFATAGNLNGYILINDNG